VEGRRSGRGMPPEGLERVGTPFFTTREQGTGLGVAMARAAFRQHGGSLEYRSEEGRGTTVVGVLPLQQERTVGAPSVGWRRTRDAVRPEGTDQAATARGG